MLTTKFLELKFKSNSLNIIFFVLLLNVFCVTCSQSSVCLEARNCNQCIRQKNCVWCKNPDFEVPGHSAKNTKRCDTIENHTKNKYQLCLTPNLEIPQNYFKLTRNEEVNQNNKIYISPQNGEVTLSVGQPVYFNLTYLENKHKTLDLYYIMDLSHTMKNHRETVVEQSQDLATELRKLTENVQFGFGSFIDKPLLPFASYEQISQPKWKQGSEEFVATYGFKNHLKLTSNIENFKDKVRKAEISGNVDPAEGGLEAVMQAIVCKDEIGWRDDAHRLIVMATDGSFHIAGDGKLGGIVIPNDMLCHLNKNGDYTHSTLIDYPSISQVNYTIGKNKIHLIFGIIKENVLPLYEQLSTTLVASSAAWLDENTKQTNTKKAKGVVQVVKEQYQSIIQNVELKMLHQGSSVDYLKVEYIVKCGINSQEKSGNTCDKVGPGDKIQFQVKLTLERCPEHREHVPKSLKFSTYNLPDNQGFNLTLNLNCDCKCSQNNPQDRLVDHNKDLINKTCNGYADRLKCGTCQCDKDHTGRNCECSKLDGVDTNNQETCKDPNDPLQPVCYGRGQCKCGQCDCHPGRSGTYCQCDDSKCKLVGMEHERECSNDQGKCNCGVCECDEKHGGDKCQCPKDNKTCQEPGRSRICNNHGNCSCTQPTDISFNWEWKCSSCDSGYSGRFCHICRGTNCPSPDSAEVESRCKEKELGECLKCHYKLYEENFSKLTEIKSKCLKHCARISPENGDILRYNVKISKSLSDDEKLTETKECEQAYNETCTMKFLYLYDSKDQDNLEVILGTPLICRPPPPTLWYIIGTVGAVLMIGILTLLLWKIFTHIHDTREFQKFESERSGAKWAKGENPLYSNPMSSFENPAHPNHAIPQ